MILCRIDGQIVSMTCHPSAHGRRMVICQPIGADGQDDGVPVLAIDPLNAGLHQRVILSTDGSRTREMVNDPKSPLRNHVVGIVDEATSAGSSAPPPARSGR